MLETLKSFAGSANHPLGLLLLFAASVIEYLFPPFPGDSVTLFGAVLITTYSWSFWLIVLATTSGSTLGAAIDYWLGAAAHRRGPPKTARGERLRARVEEVTARFKKHGELLIVVNRFLPGIRALFFYAAGYSGMRFWRVIALAAASALAWNLLLVLVGAGIGANFDELMALAERYTLAVSALLALIALLLTARWLLRRRAVARKAP
jgi:membrane protein DedA with SNARE-associated domain